MCTAWLMFSMLELHFHSWGIQAQGNITTKILIQLTKENLSFATVKQSLRTVSLERLAWFSFRQWTSCTPSRDIAIPEGSNGLPWRAQILQIWFKQSRAASSCGILQLNTADSFKQARWGPCHICMEISSNTFVSHRMNELIMRKVRRYPPSTWYSSCFLNLLFSKSTFYFSLRKHFNIFIREN